MTVNGTDRPRRRPGAPPPQNNLGRAIEMAFEAFDHQAEEQFRWLGAETQENGCRLPVLGDVFEVDRPQRRISTSAGQEVCPQWSILALHYLAVTSRPADGTPETTFADLAAARSYAGVYHDRVIARLCATAGRDAQRLSSAAATLGGRSVDVGDVAYDFDVFPRVSLRLILHAPDDEFPPSATLLLPGNIESYFCAEDIVVLSELLVARLGGRPF